MELRRSMLTSASPARSDGADRAKARYGVIDNRSGKSAALTEELNGVLSLRLFGWRFYPLVRGADESGAAKQLLDLRRPPDGEVAAGADFFLAISVCGGDRAGWGDGAGAARATGSVWRRPDRDRTAVGVTFLRFIQ